jgi:glycosyltransferase involved in cell wall biosynthesis
LTRHLAIVCPALAAGGAVASVALHQARELAAQFRVTVFSDSFPEPEMRGLARQGLKPLRFGRLRRLAHVPNELAFDLAAKAALRRVHRTSPLDMVICHGHAPAALAARPLRRALRIPYALVTHGDIFDRPAGTYDRRLTWLYQRVTPAAYRDADLIVALSPHMADCAIRGGAKTGNIVLIPNGIDPADIGLPEVSAGATQAPSERAALLYVGRLSVEKGVDVLVRAAALLKHEGVAFHLRIAGDGPQAGPMRQLVAQLALDDEVSFLGSVDRKQLASLYQSSTAVCVPSRSDPLPTVVMEAMCAGVAVVGSRTGGIPHLVDEGATGLLCAPEDAHALAMALKRLALDSGLARTMGTAARSRAAAAFSWSRSGELLAAAINETLDRRAAASR